MGMMQPQYLHGTAVSPAELAVLDGVAAGTVTALKALVVDTNSALDALTIAMLTTTTVDGPAGAALSIDAGGAYAVNIGQVFATNVVLGRGSGSVTVAGSIITTVGNGAIVTDKCTVVEGGDGVLHKTTLTFTLTGDHDLDMADDDHGTGIKIYDFPAGSIQILGATCNAIATSVNTGAGGGTFPMALGSAVGADDNTLTGTEADIIPSTAITGGTGSTASDFHATLAAPILFANAGGTNLDLYLNAAITAAVAEGAVTIAVTGTVTITWINLGDY